MPRMLRAVTDADSAATTAESRAAALQFARLVTGTVRPHPEDAQRYEALVLEIARASQELIDMKEARAQRSQAVGICRAV